MTVDSSQWRLLYFLNIYRIVLSGFFISLFYFKVSLQPFGVIDRELFHIVSLIYFGFSFFSNFSINLQWPSFFKQANIHLLVDIISLLLLTHASGGVSSGVGILLIIPIAASSILMLGVLAYFYAAIASIFLLFDQFYLFLSEHIVPSYPQAGILGMILFSTGLITNYLAIRLQDTRQLALQMGDNLKNMELLAHFVMERLQTPVMLVNNMGDILLKNEACNDLAVEVHLRDIKCLSQISPELLMMFHKWLKTGDKINDSFMIENSRKELLPQFAALNSESNHEVIIFLEDISKLKSQAQQQKLASLGRLTASIAHEIRNPLSAISHAGQLLAESETLDPQDVRLTRIIDQHSRRLNEIIDTVLNLSRKNNLQQQQIDLKNWMENFLTHQIQFSVSQIRLEQHEDISIEFDPQHLQQILINLIANAFEHGIDNSEQKAGDDDVNNVVIKLYKTAERTCLDILNHGEAIQYQHVEHLFEPFFTTRSSGTGLGLYMAKELAESNGASLIYVRIQDQTCFRLCI